MRTMPWVSWEQQEPRTITTDCNSPHALQLCELHTPETSGLIAFPSSKKASTCLTLEGNHSKTWNDEVSSGTEKADKKNKKSLTLKQGRENGDCLDLKLQISKRNPAFQKTGIYFLQSFLIFLFFAFIFYFVVFTLTLFSLTFIFIYHILLFICLPFAY